MRSFVLLLLLTLIIGIFPLSVYLLKTLRGPSKDSSTLDSDLIQEKKLSGPHQWWEDRRGKYNYGLLSSGLVAFSLYLITYFLVYHSVNFFSAPSLFSFLFIIVSYLIYMGVANLFYNLGHIIETALKPTDKPTFRNRFFIIGYWVSVSLPFLALVAAWIELGVFE